MHVEEGHKGYSTPLGGLYPQNHLHVPPQLIKHHQPTWPHIACASVNQHRCQCGKNDGIPRKIRKMIYRFSGVVTFLILFRFYFSLPFWWFPVTVNCSKRSIFRGSCYAGPTVRFGITYELREVRSRSKITTHPVTLLPGSLMHYDEQRYIHASGKKNRDKTMMANLYPSSKSERTYHE